MYEDKKRKIKINWKSLLIKIIILLIALFIILWIISLVNKKDNVKSNIASNLKVMQEAANEYFTGSRLPEKINSKKTITLEEMVNSKLLVEFKDQNGKACDLTNSYAEATKISAQNYTIKVKLICGKENDYVIDTITVEDIDTPSNSDDNINNEQVSGNEEQDNTQNNTTNNQTSNSSTSTNKPSGTTKPSTTSKPSTNNSSTNNSTSNTCPYGNKEYLSSAPLAYEISGNCAVSKSEYLNYSNKVNPIGTQEYTKIKKEIEDLAKTTGTSLYVEAPVYNGVYNVTNTGLVGYQIKFIVKQRLTYSTKVIYEYYIDGNGNRKAIIDNRASLKVTNNNTTSSSSSLSIKLNTSSQTLNVGGTFNLVASGNFNGQTVLWNTSNSVVAYVDQKGVVQAKSPGVATITAAVGYKTVSAKITVVGTNIPVSSLNISPSSKTMYVGDSYYLYANVSPSNATNKTVTWSSSDTSIATVDKNGMVSAKRTGTVTIWAETNNRRAQATINVIERNTAVTKVEILDNDLELNINDTHKLQYRVEPDGAIYNKRVYFEVANANVLRVDSNGVLTAVGAGRTRVTVTVDGKSDYIYVTVVAQNKVTEAYYLMTLIKSYHIGTSVTQEFVLKDVPSSAKITSVKVDYYGTNLSNYSTYSSFDWNSKIKFNSGYSLTGVYKGEDPNVLKYYSLNTNEYSFSNIETKVIGNNWGVKFTTNIKSANNHEKYLDAGYFVPAIVIVSYE